jgi:CheY-like chemotaxis protein
MAAPRQRHKLLIIDDDRDLLTAIGFRFNAKGFEVASAADGAEALKLFKSHRPDLVIIDVRLPTLDGLLVLREFKKADPRVPIVVMSGDFAHARLMLQEGACDFVAKPVNLDYLDMTVDANLLLRDAEAGAAEFEPWMELLAAAKQVHGGSEDLARRLVPGDHACFFFDDAEQQALVTAAYLFSGLTRGERCVFVGDEREIRLLGLGLKTHGIDLEAENRRGRLILSSERDYLDGGHWDTGKMLGFLEDAYDSAMDAGFPALRAAGDMSWEVGQDQDYGDVARYEELLDRFFIGKKMVGLCQYPKARCPVDLVESLLSSHRHIAVDSKVSRNDLYVAPDAPRVEQRRS